MNLVSPLQQLNKYSISLVDQSFRGFSNWIFLFIYFFFSDFIVSANLTPASAKRMKYSFRTFLRKISNSTQQLKCTSKAEYEENGSVWENFLLHFWRDLVIYPCYPLIVSCLVSLYPTLPGTSLVSSDSTAFIHPKSNIWQWAGILLWYCLSLFLLLSLKHDL